MALVSHIPPMPHHNAFGTSAGPELLDEVS